MATPSLLDGLGVKRWRFWQRPGRRVRRLQLMESLAMGDRRFVAVLRVDGREFLVGATPQSVALLCELAGEPGDLSEAVVFASSEVQ